MSGFSSGASPAIVIAQSAVAVPHTGDTAEFTLATITLPAGAMGANGVLKIVPRFSYAGAGGNRTPRIKFGGTTIASAAVAAANLAERYNIEVFNKNSQSSQLTSYDRANTNGSAMANGTAAIDTSAAVTILITGQLAVGTDTITLEGYQIIVNPKA